MSKTTVFNLIILDESGSMSSCTRSTISGCNETINVARTLQNNNPDTQRVLMSIYAFQSDSKIQSRYICKNIPVTNVTDVTNKDYRPWGCTPLYDAVGATLTDVMAVAATHEDATGIVTIITDGMENSSTHYDLKQVARLIDRLKEMGWTINFIGANIDVEATANELHIDNAMAFQSSEEGTYDMFDKFSKTMAEYENSRICEEAALSHEARMAYRKKRNKSFFGK